MELLQQAWHAIDDPWLLVAVSLFFLWLARVASRDNNAPMKDWEWDEE